MQLLYINFYLQSFKQFSVSLPQVLWIHFQVCQTMGYIDQRLKRCPGFLMYGSLINRTLVNVLELQHEGDHHSLSFIQPSTFMGFKLVGHWALGYSTSCLPVLQVVNSHYNREWYVTDFSNLGKSQRAHILNGTAGHSTTKWVCCEPLYKQLITFREIRGKLLRHSQRSRWDEKECFDLFGMWRSCEKAVSR